MHVQNSLISPTPPALTGTPATGSLSAQRPGAVAGKGGSLVGEMPQTGGPSLRLASLTDVAATRTLTGANNVITLTDKQIDSIADAAKRAFADPIRLTDVTPPAATPDADQQKAALTDLTKPLAPADSPITIAPRALTDVTPPKDVRGHDALTDHLKPMAPLALTDVSPPNGARGHNAVTDLTKPLAPADSPITIAPRALTDITPPGTVVGSRDSLALPHDAFETGKALTDLPRDKVADQFFDALVKKLDSSRDTVTSRNGLSLSEELFTQLDRDGSSAIDPRELAESLADVYANRANDVVGGPNMVDLAENTIEYSDPVSQPNTLTTEADFRARLDSMAKEIAARLEDAGFVKQPPLNIQSLIGQLALPPAGSNLMLQMLASRFPEGLGISMLG